MSSRTVGSPVIGCSHANHENNNSDHSDCAIEILSIVDPDFPEYEFKDSQKEITVENLNQTPLRITYEVKVCTMQVTVWIEYDSANSIHSEFYSNYEGNGVTGRRLIILQDAESKEPNSYDISWDGRDETDDHRFLLEGTYTLHIQGLHEITLNDQTTIIYPKPNSCNFGIHYHEKNKNNNNYFLETTKLEIEHAKEKQLLLADSTSFQVESHVDSSADSVWSTMGFSSVVTTATHSDPFSLFFYSEESTSRRQARFRRNNSSSLDIFGDDNDDNDVILSNEQSDYLRDVFLVILAGCRSGDELFGAQNKLHLLSEAFNPGRVDGDHGSKTTAALQEWQSWENIEPSDGSKTQATLDAFNIDSTLNERRQTIAVQRKLRGISRRYNPGRVNGIWRRRTETALMNYQEDHPPLEINSLPDQPTLAHLLLDGSEGSTEINMVDAFVRRGCNIVFGFKKKVSFRAAEQWHIKFWDLLAEGAGIDDAATGAISECPRRYHSDLEYMLLTRDGVDKNETLHPARYGRDM